MADKRSKRTRGARKRCTSDITTGDPIAAENSVDSETEGATAPVTNTPTEQPVTCATEPAECADQPVTCEAEPAVSDCESAVAEAPQGDFTPSRTFTQHHVAKILDELLEEEIPEEALGKNRFRYPLVIDAVLALGLLIAVAGFTVGISKMFVTHQAQQYIMASDYRAAIMLLRSTPLPQAFGVDGSDPDEALSQALYLDSLTKFDKGENDPALKQLEQIRAGSKYFDQAQRLLTDNFVPADTMLECSITEDAQMQAQR